MATTFNAGTLLTRANKLMGVLGGNEVMPPDVAEDSLAILNALLDGFATQELAMPATSRDVYSFTANVNTYLIGPGQTWNATRPTEIQNAAVFADTASPAFEIPMGLLDDQSYQAITIKDMPMTFPVQLYYNALNDVAGSIFVWGTPTDAANYQQVLYTPTQLVQFGDLTTSVTMAPGYYRMLYYNVALELGMAFQTQPRADVMQAAEKSLKDIKRINLQAQDLTTNAGLPGVNGIYNIFGDVNY